MSGLGGAVESTAPVSRLHEHQSFDLADFPVPTGREEEWRFTPLRRLRGLHSDALSAAGKVAVEASAAPGIAALRPHSGDPRCGADVQPDLPRSGQGVSMQPPQTAKRREPPLLYTPSRHRKLIQRERLVLVQPGHGGRGVRGPLERRHQPTAPSI